MTFYRINEIKLKIGESKDRIPEHILKRLGRAGRGLKITEYRIVKQSIDARDKGEIMLVYSVDFAVERNMAEKERAAAKAGGEERLKASEVVLDLPVVKPAVYALPERGSRKPAGRPVICGFGPCGMFAGLILSSAGYRPIIIERGSSMEKRTEKVRLFWEEGRLDTECNVQFGEGGAGTFSDGKLTTNIKDPRIAKVLEEFVAAGASEEIKYMHKPHIGTDVLRDVVVNIRKKITELGGEIRFDTKLIGINAAGGRLESITLEKSSDGVKERKDIKTDCLILATGHSARDTMQMLYDSGIEMTQKPFSIGLRIQHPQSLINRAQYGEDWQQMGLPPAEYKLSYHCRESGRGVYTFCMCPGGEVIAASSAEGMTVTNGMSYHARDGECANSALLVDVRTSDYESDHPLAGIRFQEKYERLAFENGAGYKPPVCSWGEFSKGTEKGKKVRACIPEFATQSMLEAMPVMARRLRGFDDKDAQLFAVESRSSSPVRISRNEEYNASVEGIYPGGEGAGYAGGIVSAAVDGIKLAETVISRFAPCDE